MASLVASARPRTTPYWRLRHGLLNTHGRPTPKPRKNNVEAEIHFNITEERETIFYLRFSLFE